MKRTVITGTGSYIPDEVKVNNDFTVQDFYNEKNELIPTIPSVIVEKFQAITGIEERRYAPDGITASSMATIAAREAIAMSGVDPETLDQLILAHNFGDVVKHSFQSDAVPSLASRVKHELGIKNPNCIPYDVLFGCPGWLQGVIQADAFLKRALLRKRWLSEVKHYRG